MIRYSTQGQIATTETQGNITIKVGSTKPLSPDQKCQQVSYGHFTFVCKSSVNMQGYKLRKNETC